MLPDAAAARIVTSPLGRARRTAEIICEHLDPAPELGLDDRLRELSIGSWDGLTYSEIAMCAPESSMEGGVPSGVSARPMESGMRALRRGSATG